MHSICAVQRLCVCTVVAAFDERAAEDNAGLGQSLMTLLSNSSSALSVDVVLQSQTGSRDGMEELRANMSILEGIEGAVSYVH